MLRAISHSHGGGEPAGTIRLDHAARHLRRKLVTTDQGEEIMVDLPEPVLFADGDRLVLEDGRAVAIVAAQEELYEVLSGPACPCAISPGISATVICRRRSTKAAS